MVAASYDTISNTNRVEEWKEEWIETGSFIKDVKTVRFIVVRMKVCINLDVQKRLRRKILDIRMDLNDLVMPQLHEGELYKRVVARSFVEVSRSYLTLPAIIYKL